MKKLHDTINVIKESGVRKDLLIVLIFVLCILSGLFLRLPPPMFESNGWLSSLEGVEIKPGFKGKGFDEHLYEKYVEAVAKEGIFNYPRLIEGYLQVQKELKTAILPPTRFVYIECGNVWSYLTGNKPYEGLKEVSAIFTILYLTVVATICVRTKLGLSKSGIALSLTALCPTQIHMSQHALIDGVFGAIALCTLWLFWECLQNSQQRKYWLSAYALMIGVCAITKENCVFVYAGVITCLAFEWIKTKKAEHKQKIKETVISTMLGGLGGIGALSIISGGLDNLIEMYSLMIAKAQMLPYAIKTGDGPWQRYFVDYSIINPIVILLAILGIGQLLKENYREGSWRIVSSVFVIATYGAMAQVRYGMNLRYTNMWDGILCILAAWSIVEIIENTLKNENRNNKKIKSLVTALSCLIVCGMELKEYNKVFVTNPTYELVPEALLRSEKILK